MKNRSMTVFGAALLLLGTVSLDAFGDTGNYTLLESMVGKFEGVIQVENSKPVGHKYQTEIVSVDLPANTVSLTAECNDCGIKRWARTSCEIREKKERIRFTCRGPKSDEDYSYDGKALTATGFGNKYPYSINVTKLAP